VVQHGAAVGRIRRKTDPAPAKAAYVPENSMRSNIEELKVKALPEFQQAVDKVDERGIIAAGDQMIKAIWDRVEVSVAKLWTRSWPRPDMLRECENCGHPCSNGAISNLP
jgi:hypothetical protein